MEFKYNCETCANKNWSIIWTDNFVCQKCRQKQEREAREKTVPQKNKK